MTLTNVERLQQANLIVQDDLSTDKTNAINSLSKDEVDHLIETSINGVGDNSGVVAVPL